MSIENNNPAEPTDTNLDDFAVEFFGEGSEAPRDANVESQEDDVADGLDAPTNNDEVEDAHVEPDDEAELEETTETDEAEPEEEEAESEAPKPFKKTRAQERIEELNAKYREEERQRLALEARVRELEGQKKSEPTKTETPTNEPLPTDKNEDGSDKYPLGEFDPQYIKDLITHVNTQERQQTAQELANRDRERETTAAQQQLEQEWQGKVNSAQERYPDFGTKAQELAEVFDGIDQSYGDYLGNTLMSMENGADVLYYLANNPDEARAIANSGAAKATLALGRISAKVGVEDVKPKVTKATKAPPPPPRTRGSGVAKTVSPDTDNLDDFSKLLFKD